MTAMILVVDDELAMRMGLQQVLKKEGYHVELAGDGQEVPGGGEMEAVKAKPCLSKRESRD